MRSCLAVGDFTCLVAGSATIADALRKKCCKTAVDEVTFC